MRKFHKQMLKELLSTLKEANSEIFNSKNKAYIPTLISGIDEFITAVNTYIENNAVDTDENKKPLLDLLNDYKQKLTCDINTLDLKQLKQQIYNIEVLAQKLKINQFEVVFVVDSKSKSDALLPIYEVAKADPNCIARWMPVPLYGLNNIGQKSEVKFDGQDKYPNIECTDFKLYDLEKNHPEVIFTNNIYDEGNFVTQLFPEFWTEKLKKYTDFLIYVPYFVAGENMTETAFVKLGGMLNVNLVVLENEKIRKFYAETAKEFFGNRFDINKFVALGSPKYDETLKYAELAEKGELEIPQDWKEKIYKTDGTKRKVVFYNTSISALLRAEKPEMYCEKVGIVLAAFKRRLEEKDDVVLLWRPHPLFFTTIKSMRPMIAEKWQRITGNYKNNNFGIYDENGDMHRAIALSDCYYGDGSSVVQLFDMLNKDVFGQEINNNQNIEILNEVYTNPLAFFKFKESIYEIDVNSNILKFGNKTFNFYREIQKPTKSNLYSEFSDIEIKNNDLWIFPRNGDRIAKLDFETDSLDFYQLELQEEYISQLDGNNRNFFQGLFYKNKVFFVPCAYRAIIAYDFDTGETEHCLDLRKHFPKEKMHTLFYGYEWLNENTILMPSLYTNEIFEFCLETYDFKIHKLGRKDRFFHTIQKNGDDYFLVGRQPFVAKWNYETGDFVYYDKLPKGFKVLKKSDWTWAVNNIKPYNGKIILLGGYTNMALEFDLDTCKYKQIDSINTVNSNKEQEDISFSTCNFIDNEKLYFIKQNETFCCYNFENGDFEEICKLKFDFPNDMIEKFNNNFIDRIVYKDTEDDKFMITPCADKIHDYIKKMVKL